MEAILKAFGVSESTKQVRIGAIIVVVSVAITAITSLIGLKRK